MRQARERLGWVQPIVQPGFVSNRGRVVERVFITCELSITVDAGFSKVNFSWKRVGIECIEGV